MFYFSQEEWIEINRVFLTAFEQFWNEGTELQIIELNHKSIEISFSRQVRLSPHRFHVEIYRRDVDELLETSFDPRTDDTKEIIQMLFQLAWLTKLPYYFRITTNDCEEEFEQIREILLNVYHDCYQEISAAYSSKSCVIEHMIVLHDRKIVLRFTRGEMFDINGNIDVTLYCDNSYRAYFDLICQDDPAPEEVIQMIQKIGWLTKQPYSFRIKTNDCEEEYAQLRDIMVNLYNDCFEEISAPHRDGLYVIKHMIELHSQKFFLHFTRGEMFDINGSIDVSIHCYPSDKKYSDMICQDDPAPEEIIQMIRNLAHEGVTTAKQLSIAEYDDICRIVEGFMGKFDMPSIGNDSLESLEYWTIKSEYLSQDPTATVPNVRFLTTAGIMDLYFYFDAFDMRIPDVESINLINPPPKEGDSCVVFALNEKYRKYLYYDAHWYSSIIETIAPAVASSIYNTVCSTAKKDDSTGQ